MRDGGKKGEGGVTGVCCCQKDSSTRFGEWKMM